MIQLEVVDIWIHMTRGIALMDFIPALILRDIIVITVIILIGGVRGGIFHISSKSKPPTFDGDVKK